MCVCVCVCVFFPFILDVRLVGRTSRAIETDTRYRYTVMEAGVKILIVAPVVCKNKRNKVHVKLGIVDQN